MPRFKVVRVRRVDANIWRYAVHDNVLHRLATFGPLTDSQARAHNAQRQMSEDAERIHDYLWSNESRFL